MLVVKNHVVPKPLQHFRLRPGSRIDQAADGGELFRGEGPLFALAVDGGGARRRDDAVFPVRAAIPTDTGMESPKLPAMVRMASAKPEYCRWGIGVKLVPIPRDACLAREKVGVFPLRPVNQNRIRFVFRMIVGLEKNRNGVMPGGNLTLQPAKQHA